MAVDWEEAPRATNFPVAQALGLPRPRRRRPLPRSLGRMPAYWVDDQKQNGVVHWPDWEAKLLVVAAEPRHA